MVFLASEYQPEVEEKYVMAVLQTALFIAYETF